MHAFFRQRDRTTVERGGAAQLTMADRGLHAELMQAASMLPLALPVPGRPIRSLVAEEWSTKGVRDQAGPEPDAHKIAHGTRRDTPG